MAQEPLDPLSPEPGQTLNVTNRRAPEDGYEGYDPFAPLTPEQVRKFKEEPRSPREGLSVESIDNLGSGLDLDPETLDPAYNYRWTHKSPKKMARARAKGYRLVDPALESGICTVGGESPETATDGTYTVGDVVLMKVPKSTHKKRRKAIAKRRDDRLRGPERKFRREAQAASSRLTTPVEVITTKGD